jgi:hypothetical protein
VSAIVGCGEVSLGPAHCLIALLETLPQRQRHETTVWLLDRKPGDDLSRTW